MLARKTQTPRRRRTTVTEFSALPLGLAGLVAALALGATGCGPQGGDEPDPNDGEPEDVRLICDQEYLTALTELVESAEQQLSIVQWELFQGEATSAVLNRLGEAADRGVHVQVLLDDDIEENAAGVQWMVNRGIDAQLDHDEQVRLHAKMLIADNEMMLIGSTNWSNSSIRRNRECNLLARRPQSAAYLREWFEGLLLDPGDRQPPAAAQDEAEDFSVVVDDQILERLLEQLSSAQSRIDFTLYATYLQPADLGAPAMQLFSALTAAADRGVPVRGIADWSDWNNSNNDSNEDAVNWLRARGVDIRWEDAATTTHAKIFRIDDSVQIQSANISSGGFRWNREAGAWTRSPSVLDDIGSWFEELWAESTLEPVDR